MTHVPNFWSVGGNVSQTYRAFLCQRLTGEWRTKPVEEMLIECGIALDFVLSLRTFLLGILKMAKSRFEFENFVY